MPHKQAFCAHLLVLPVSHHQNMRAKAYSSASVTRTVEKQRYPHIEFKGPPAPISSIFGSAFIGRTYEHETACWEYSVYGFRSPLQATFAKFGPVDTVEIARDPSTLVSKGFATVAMARDEDAAKPIGRLNFTQYAGRTIGVSRSRRNILLIRLDL